MPAEADPDIRTVDASDGTHLLHDRRGIAEREAGGHVARAVRASECRLQIGARPCAKALVEPSHDGDVRSCETENGLPVVAAREEMGATLTDRVRPPYLPSWSSVSVPVEIVVGRTQQRLRPPDVFPVADGDLSIASIGWASKAVLERERAHVLPMDVYAEAAPDKQMDVSNYRRLVAWSGRALE